MADERIKEFAESYLYLSDMIGSVPEEDRYKIVTAMTALRLHYDCYLEVYELREFLKRM